MLKRPRSAIHIIPDDVIPPPANSDSAKLPKGFGNWFICRLLRVTGLASLADDGVALAPGHGKLQGAILHIAFAYILWALPMTSMGEPGGFSWGITLGFYAGQANGVAKAWAMWFGWDVEAFNNVFRGLNQKEIFVCKVCNIAIGVNIVGFMFGPWNLSPFLPYAFVSDLDADAAQGGGLRDALPYTAALYVAGCLHSAFQAAATSSFLMCCIILAIKTSRFKKRVERASTFFLARWDKVHGSFLDASASAAAYEEDGAVDPAELERIEQEARIKDIEINDLARKLGHSLIQENTVLHRHTPFISQNYAYYFLGAEFLMILAVISWSIGIAGGPTAQGYTGAVPTDLNLGVGIFYICSVSMFVVAVIGAPLSITHCGLKVCEAFRRRPCAIWNDVGDHLHRDVLAFSTLGHVIGPSAFLVGAYAVSSFFVWQWVEAKSGISLELG